MVAIAAGFLAAGVAISVLGSMNQAAATEDAARYNAKAAEEDIKLLRIEESQKTRLLRERGAANIAAIKTVAGAAGISMTSGSALNVIAKQASVNAQNEYLLRSEAEAATLRIRNAARLGGIQAANQAAGQRLSGIGAGLTGAEKKPPVVFKNNSLPLKSCTMRAPLSALTEKS